MSRPVPSRSAAPSPVRAPPPAPGALRWGVHLLVAVLLAVGAARSALSTPPDWAALASSGAVAAVYVLGQRWRAVATAAWAAGAWLTVLLLAWFGLLVLTPDATYLAFPWFFLLLYLLPRPVGLAAVVVTTAAAVTGFAWHQGALTPAMVVGPALGAAAAVATVWGYQAVQAESEQRRRLIVEVARTRGQLAEAQHQTGVLDERERLAREIHDTLAQGLSSIQLLLTAAGTSLTPVRTAEQLRASELVEQARLTAQENLDEARRFVRALTPPDLEESTLPSALERLCTSTTDRTGIPVSFHEIGRVPLLPTPVEVALLRIARAALDNVSQHAGADRADVTLTGMDAAVTLDVVDDGRGFDTDAPVPGTGDQVRQGGFGLRSIRSRAADVGGVVSVESRPGHGTAVSVHVDRPARTSSAARPTDPPAARLSR